MNKLKLEIQRFSSTNATTHYNLSQYIGSDKPTYLVDYNGDMSKIDTGIYNADAKGTQANDNIGTMSSLTTTATTDLVSAINEVDAHADTNATNISNNTTDIATNTSAIGTLANLTTSAKNNLVSAINEVDAKAGISGQITMFAGSIAPSGWLICDGSAISRTTYSDLYSVIGTTYGAGDESTTFNLPNLKGKVAVGYDSSDSHFDNLGETGGEVTHTLIGSEMPEHQHNARNFIINASGSIEVGSGSQHLGIGDDTTATGSAGGNQPHNNLQPYIVLNYIIKI